MQDGVAQCPVLEGTEPDADLRLLISALLKEDSVPHVDAEISSLKQTTAAVNSR